MKNYLDLNAISRRHVKRSNIRKWKKQRIERGFSDYDWWDLDSFFTNLIANSLEHYANNTIGWDNTVASSPEEYKERILNLAAKFQEMAEWEERHEDIKDYKENWEKLDTLTKEAFKELAEVYWGLWD